ncbi:hypothetical protein NE237_002217 [Protea cynaroides]|uniref:pectinesterase n=1 Tax=Protea cynaroides TaxID=273540 RepID=A0A9Q0KUU1_9MAGN|nr:hypothetical protein NE237_002217 [Protea cynaroides]
MEGRIIGSVIGLGGVGDDMGGGMIGSIIGSGGMGDGMGGAMIGSVIGLGGVGDGIRGGMIGLVIGFGGVGDDGPRSVGDDVVCVNFGGHGIVPSITKKLVATDHIEQVKIGKDKPCIFLEGVNSKTTIIQYDAHEATDTSITFSLLAENFVAKNIGFKNTYNLDGAGHPRVPAVAAFIYGDKASFYSCGFIGLQDTLWDELGRHYFEQCYIEGAMDFIFGGGQTIYEKCTIQVTADALYQSNGGIGFITAQRRLSADHPSGYVFKQAAVVGRGLTHLGRAYGPYSRVIFVRSMLSEVVVPEGWNAWTYVGQEENLVYAESRCFGVGSDTSKRVPWEKKLSDSQLRDLTELSFIDQEGWIEKQPKG